MPEAATTALTTKQAFRRVFPGVMVAMFLAAADQTILASALPTIATSLGGLADVSWVVVAYLLAATIAAPLYGHLGDRFGRRRMLLGALGLFTVASAACRRAGIACSARADSTYRAISTRHRRSALVLWRHIRLVVRAVVGRTPLCLVVVVFVDLAWRSSRWLSTARSVGATRYRPRHS